MVISIKYIDLTNPEFTDLPSEGVRYTSRLLDGFCEPVQNRSDAYFELVLFQPIPGAIPVPQSHRRPKIVLPPSDIVPVAIFVHNGITHHVPIIPSPGIGEEGIEMYYAVGSPGSILYHWESGRMEAVDLDKPKDNIHVRRLGEIPHAVYCQPGSSMTVLAAFIPPYQEDPPETDFLHGLKEDIEKDLSRRVNCSG